VTLYVVAGPPGAGKSTVAARLAPLLRPVPALLDKDVLFAGFVAEVQQAHGRAAGEREGSWYDRHVKVHEYGGITAAARQIRGAGCPVMLVAPFTGQIRDPGRWASWVDELGGGPATLIWVRTRVGTLHARLRSRGSGLDVGKLAAFDDFVARMRPEEPPPVPHEMIDNDGDLAALVGQIEGLAGRLG